MADEAEWILEYFVLSTVAGAGGETGGCCGNGR